MNKRSRTLQSAKNLKKKQQKHILTIVLSCVSTLAVCTALIFLFRISFFEISSVVFTGNKNIEQQELLDFVQSQLDGNYPLFIPHSNRLVYPHDRIRDGLLTQFPRLKNVEIDAQGMHELHITLEERDPVALICEGFHEENELVPHNTADENSSAEVCSFVDEYGFAFAKAPQFSTGVYMKYYGTTTLETAEFKRLQTFADGILRAGLLPLGILIDQDGTYELYIKNKDLSEAVVYFDDRVPFSKTLSNLVAFWNTTTSKKKNATTTNFDSINLRFGNTIYYVTK